MTLSPEEEQLYRALFLNADDMPDLDAREAVHRADAEAGDHAWTSCRGIMAGFQVWQRIRGTDLTRVVDIRWLFPSEGEARRYHTARIAANAEGFREVTGIPIPGVVVNAFSGRDPFGLGGEMRIFLFAIDRVTAKVFVSGLEPRAGEAIVRRAESRIGAALRASG
jgi:hypothetical protein